MYKYLEEKLEDAQRKNPLTVEQTVLVVVLTLSLVLRLYNLKGESLYLDEIYSLERSKLGPSKLYDVSYRPLYFFMMHYWIKLLGTSEIALRLPAMLFGVLAVFVLYKISYLLFDEKIAGLSALILALSEFHVWQSQDVRMYSLLALLAGLSIYFFLLLVKERNTLPVIIGYITSSILLLFTHPFGVFVLIVQNAFFLTLLLHKGSDLKTSLKGWIFQQVILFISFLPLLRGYLGKASGIQSGEGLSWLAKPTAATLLIVFNEYSGHVLLFLLFIVVICLYFYGMKERSEEKEATRGEKIGEKIGKEDLLNPRTWIDLGARNEKLYLLCLWILLPNLLPFLASWVWKPIYGPPKYTIAASLGFYVLIALSISRLDRKKLKVIFIALIIVLGAFNLGVYYAEPDKEQWEETVDYVEENAESEDLVVFNAGFTRLCFDYYSEREDLTKRAFPNETRPRMPRKLSRNVEVNQSHIEELNELTQGHERVWLVLSHTRGDTDLIIKDMKKDFEISRHKEYVEVEVYLFER